MDHCGFNAEREQVERVGRTEGKLPRFWRILCRALGYTITVDSVQECVKSYGLHNDVGYHWKQWGSDQPDFGSK